MSEYLLPLYTQASVKRLAKRLKFQHICKLRGTSEAEQGKGKRLDLTNVCPQQATNEG